MGELTMPKLPTDLTKAHAYSGRLKKLRAQAATKRAEDERRSAEAIQRMREEFAQEHGVPESEVTMIFCRRGRR
jgi:hypothetical protein